MESDELWLRGLVGPRCSCGQPIMRPSRESSVWRHIEDGSLAHRAGVPGPEPRHLAPWRVWVAVRLSRITRRVLS